LDRRVPAGQRWIADLCPNGEDSPFMILHPGVRRSPPRWIMVFAQVAGMLDDLCGGVAMW
jgi:hypothetical protein